MECPHCSTDLPAQVRFCPYCGKQIPATQSRRARWMLWFVPFLVLFVVAALAFVIFSQDKNEAEGVGPTDGETAEGSGEEGTALAESVTAPVPTGTVLPTQTPEVPLPSFSPPLADVPFPEQPVSYPTDWPEALRLPAAFTLVETESGALLENDSVGWGAKLRFPGDLAAAAAELTTYFEKMGWQIAERVDPGGGSALLFISASDGEGEGMVVVDRDPSAPESSLIMLMLVPEENE